MPGLLFPSSRDDISWSGKRDSVELTPVVRSGGRSGAFLFVLLVKLNFEKSARRTEN